MSYQEIFYPESRFGGFTDVDGTVAFYTRVNAILEESFTVVDLGCGRGAWAEDDVAFRRNLRILRGKVQRVIGLDADATAACNPYLDEFHLLDGRRWPLDDNSADLVLSDCVVEHLEEPEEFFREAHRVLRNRGYLCVRTPNRWNYIALCSRLIANRHHAKVLQVVQRGRKQEDVFPALYRCNTVHRMRVMLKRHGFDCAVYGYEAEPSYLSFSKLAYWLGVLHQRYAPRLLRPVIFAFGRAKKNVRGTDDLFHGRPRTLW